MTWKAADIGDLHHRNAVVTGANSGLGFFTALELARHGAHVVLACRSLERGAAAAEQIEKEVPGADVTLSQLDLADLRSIRAFAAAFESGHDGLDILVNNAGVMAIPRAQTADGFEMQFGTNHLGHFALTGLLMPALLVRHAPRVVTVSSLMHLIGHINFDDPQRQRRYSKWLAYGQAKLSNLLFAFELDRRANKTGIPLVSVAAHPGYAATNLQAAGPTMAGRPLQARAMEALNVVIAQSAARGALPTLYGATAPNVSGGQFFGPSFGMRGWPVRSLASPAAHSRDAAARLWSLSEELTGVTFGIFDKAA